jgi:transposase-like protein
MTGRPSDYSPEKAEAICSLIASGESVRAISQRDDMPAESTIYLWLAKESAFSERYARAREQQADVYAQEIVSIADEAKDAQIARLQMDARKWAASKLAPKKYGDKLDLNHGGQKNNPVQVIELIAPDHDNPED